ncbi:MAG: aldose 1-epimerase family protein [Bacteroidetes bacterium]|nr:aldose 1-epimerase family protein [Fibrella sp.]
MAILQNEQLRVEIRPKGAELTSITNLGTGVEHIWSANPAIWGWHAPNLFPVVGGCLDNQLLIGDKAYPMERHGFARQSVFAELESTASRAVFSLRATDVMREKFPYVFDFRVIYELDGPRLSVTYRVANEGDQLMFFSVGAHPAFNVPFLPGERYEDYVIEFEREEQLQTHLLSASGLFSGETQPVPLRGCELVLTPHLFDQDALVFKNLQSRRVVLKSSRNDHSVAVTFRDFPYLGLWAKSGAPFVCIEPWLGCADSEGEPVDIEQKELIQHVDAGGVFDAGFSIEVR